jgi:hypothetical protein
MNPIPKLRAKQQLHLENSIFAAILKIKDN